MSDSPVSFELQDDVAVLRMDDGKANALSFTMLDALTEGLARSAAEAKSTVLIGRAGRFCAGFDLKHMMAGPAQARELVTRGADVLLAAYAHANPLVIACTGHALAGGALLVLTGDLRIGAMGDFKIGLNEVAIGMPLPILALEMARDRLAPAKLTEATLTAQQYSPMDAVSAGYLDEVVAPEVVVPAALEQARRLSALGGAAFAASKRALRGRSIQYIRDTLEQNLREFGA
ncbi:MAG: crotonase/enoyl-CoA hydratase family protein [Myxococcales bacterium]|nr:crotonase/enoyl-CoA hydratase family protein [Myxococcales bacterium]MCB9576248.1 crotonase/enoyl-CoA hydratase family protein [Polyangiaceae bacterium]